MWQGGYINQSVGTHLSTNAIFTALDGLWENNGMNNVTPGVYRADPSEIVADGGDLMRLANDILTRARDSITCSTSPRTRSPGSGGRGGGRVRQPGHQVHLKLTVHPWMSQGTALLMSYQLPQTWSHVDNAWEMACVQDYVSVAWPVIDATFRYSHLPARHPGGPCAVLLGDFAGAPGQRHDSVPAKYSGGCLMPVWHLAYGHETHHSRRQAAYRRDVPSQREAARDRGRGRLQ